MTTDRPTFGIVAEFAPNHLKPPHRTGSIKRCEILVLRLSPEWHTKGGHGGERSAQGSVFSRKVAVSVMVMSVEAVTVMVPMKDSLP